ncbi:uncharacterized protein ACDP82_009841 isoform 1-T1 [Pangshura tecta]
MDKANVCRALKRSPELEREAAPEQWSCRFLPEAGAEPEYSSKALDVWVLEVPHHHQVLLLDQLLLVKERRFRATQSCSSGLALKGVEIIMSNSPIPLPYW